MREFHGIQWNFMLLFLPWSSVVSVMGCSYQREIMSVENNFAPLINQRFPSRMKQQGFTETL